MPKTDKDAKIPCPDTATLQIELESLSDTLDLGEREDTWEKLERALLRFAGVTRGGGYKLLPLYVEGLGRGRGRIAVGPQITACMLSDRGRLSGTATDLVQTFAPRLASNFQPLVSIYLPPLIQLLGRPNKVVLKRTEKCLSTIISNCHLPGILLELKKGLYEDAATCRRGCASAFEVALCEWAVDEGVWNDKTLGVLEEGLKRMATDKDAEVRQIGKRVWASYQRLWPERIDEFSAPLTPTIRRYLDIAPSRTAAPKPKPRVKNPAKVPLPPSRPLSVASSASSSSAHVEVPVSKQPPRPAPILHKARSMRVLPTVSNTLQRRDSPIKRSPIKTRDRDLGIRDQVPRQGSKPRPEALAPLPRSYSTYDTFSTNRTAHGMSTSQTRLEPLQPSPPKARPAPYSRPMMPKSASTLSLPSRRHHEPLVEIPPVPAVPPIIPRPRAMEVRQAYRSISTSTSSVLSDNGAVSVPRAADPCSSASSSTSSTNEPEAREDRSTVPKRSAMPPITNDSLSLVRQHTPSPVKPSSDHDTESRVPSQTSRARFESPRLPSPFLSVGAPSSVKNRIAMFEQRSQVDRSPSPTPTLSRIVSSSKPRSSSPLTRLVGEIGPDKTLLNSPLVRMDDTPRQSSAGVDASGADDTFRVGINGVSAEDLAELAEVFSAQPSGPVEPLDNSGSPQTNDDLPAPTTLVDLAEAETIQSESVIQSSDREQSTEPSMRLGSDSEPVFAVDQPASGSPTEVVFTETPAEILPTEPPSQTTKNDPIEPPKDADTNAKPTLKPSRTALPERRPIAPRPPLGPADRRPFKPTSHTQPTAASLARTASAASKGNHESRAISTSRSKEDGRSASGPKRDEIRSTSASANTDSQPSRPPLPRPAVRHPSKPPTEVRKVSQKPLATSTSSATLAPAPKPALPSSASVRSFSASTIASGLRSVAPSEAGSTFGARSDIGPLKSSIPPVPRKILAGTLPPIRKEKIKRKAPLPSFVPTRGIRPLTSSTSAPHKPQSLVGTTAKVKTVVARVKPETIPLPLSPAEKAMLPHLVPLPRSPVTQDASVLAGGSQLGKSQMTPLRKALSGTPIKAKVSPALMADSGSAQSGQDGVGTDQRIVGSPIDVWRRSIPPSPVQLWEETLPTSPLAVRRGSVPPSPLSIQQASLVNNTNGSPVSKTSVLTESNMLASPASPLRSSRTKSSTSPSPLAIHSVSVSQAPVSPTPANAHYESAPSGDVQSSTSSSGEVDSFTEDRSDALHPEDDLPSPFLRAASEGKPQTKLRLSLESTPARLRLPPTSPSPLAMATLARISAEQLVALSPTSSRSRPSMFRSDLALPADPAFPSSSTRRTKASATSTLPASDDTEELFSEDEDELLGVQFKQSSRVGSGRLRPKVKNQLVVDHDLLEFSSSSRSDRSKGSKSSQPNQMSQMSQTSQRAASRAGHSQREEPNHLTPVHGQRTDVLYSPEKSIDLLSKLVDGSPIRKTPGSHRKALWERDSNAPETDE